MKQIKYVFIFCLLLIVGSCTNSVKKQIIGHWQATDVDFSPLLKIVPLEEKAYFETLIPRMEEAMKTSEITFNSDNSFHSKTTKMGEIMEDQGSYKVADDGKKVSMISKGSSSDFTILSVSATELKVKVKVDKVYVPITWKKK